MLEIPGLPRRSKKCKICNSFSDEHLAEITEAMIRGTMTYQEILDKYNPLRLDGTRPINPPNCTSHSKHCVPERLLDRTLIRFRKDPSSVALTELEQTIIRRQGEALNKADTLIAFYTTRIKDFERAREVLIQTQFTYEGESLGPKKQKLARDIIKQTLDIEKIAKSISTDLLSHEKLERPGAPGSVHITQNVYMDSLKLFMARVVQILKSRVADKQLVRELVRSIGQALDNSMDEANLREVEEVEWETVSPGE